MNQEQDPAHAARLRQGARQILEGYQRAGVRALPAAAARSAGDDAQHANGSTQTDMATNPQATEDRQQQLDVIAAEVAKCTACSALAEARNKTVFGVGSPVARLCLLGEAPGANEDQQGEPFVGRAGQLLDKILAACTLSRDDVYILNVIKCRPPGNRNPAPEEVSNCRAFFYRQLDVIRPEYICCLGSVAAQNLLDTSESIGKLRGRLHEWNGIQVLATYHPAYLLRNPAAKAEVWKDMQFLMSEMGIEIPKRTPK